MWISVCPCRLAVQVPGEGQPGGPALHHPESHEGEQPAGVHTQRWQTGG